MSAAFIVDAEGYVRTDAGSGPMRVFVHNGLRCARIPIPECRSALLIVHGGVIDDPAFEPDAVAIAITASGLDCLIADLSELRDQIVPASHAENPCG